MTARPSDAPVRAPGTRTRSGNAMGRTRAALLQATAECVERYGVRRTTMVDVAARSGVAKATLYNHFRTKDDVLAALVESTVATLAAAAVATAGTSGPSVALAETAMALSVSPALRKAVSEEPALVAPLLVPGAGRGWTVAGEAVRAVLAAGRVQADPREVDLVLRWLVSHVAWPTTHEQAESAAGHLVRALTDSRTPSPAATVPAAEDLRPSGPAVGLGVGWPG